MKNILEKALTTHIYIYIYTKRLCDFSLALLGLVFLSPLFLLIASIIKISDGGSVFYKHKRVGQQPAFASG